MKTFFVICLALAAVAEPDAQVLLNSPFYSSLALQQPLAYAAQPLTYATVPVATKVVEEKVEEKKDVVVEVQPKVYAAPAPLTYAVQQPLAYAAQPLTYAAAPVAYTTIQQQIVPKYVAKNGEVEHIVAKREADAQLLYSNNFGYNYGYAAAPLAYSAYASPLAYNAYAAPLAYAAAPVKTTLVNPLTGVTAKTYANDFSPFTQDYASKGMYVADSVGAKHIAKRDAEPQWFGVQTPKELGMSMSTQTRNGEKLYKREAEAEPQYLAYNNAYLASPYRSAYAYGYNTLPYYGYNTLPYYGGGHG